MIITLFFLACYVACNEWNFFYYLYADNVIQYVKKFVHTTCFRTAISAVSQYIYREDPRGNDANNTHTRGGFAVFVYEMSNDKQCHNEHEVDETLYEKPRCFVHLPAIAVDDVCQQPKQPIHRQQHYHTNEYVLYW